MVSAPTDPSEVLLTRSQQFWGLWKTEYMRHSSMRCSKPTPHTSLFPNHHRPRYWLCATWNHPTSFGGVKTAQNSAPRQSICAQAREIHYEGWSVGWLGILGTWHISFCVSTILLLTTCFISNYQAQVSKGVSALECQTGGWVGRSAAGPKINFWNPL